VGVQDEKKVDFLLQSERKDYADFFLSVVDPPDFQVSFRTNAEENLRFWEVLDVRDCIAVDRKPAEHPVQLVHMQEQNAALAQP
jgi:hypothetical protein